MIQNERAVDLHAHTNKSDGSLAPAELVRLAAEKHLAALAVTDHDTTAGVAEAMAEGARIGVRVIPGIEMSTRADDCDVHMVGLFIDPENPDLLEKLVWTREARDRRNYDMVEKLRKAGYEISQEDLAAYEDGKILTRGNIAEILVKRGYAQTVTEGMSAFLRKGKVGYVRREVPVPEDCIRLIHQAGGLAFVAHFHQIDPKDIGHCERVARELIRCGADGLETRYCQFDDALRARAEAIASDTGCLRSGGSDFHGALKKGLELGTGYGDLFVPEHFLTAIEAARDAGRGTT